MIFYSDLVSMLILSSLCRFFLSAAYRDIKDSQQTVKDIILFKPTMQKVSSQNKVIPTPNCSLSHFFLFGSGQC